VSHVEITLRSGATIKADVSEWVTQKHPLDNRLLGFRWVDDGPRKLQRLDIDEVAAVIFVDDDEPEEPQP
jgi:hypothetical protein